MTAAAIRLSAALADRYRIERELGTGGMATVYLARDQRHDRDVALKVLHPELAESLGRQRFLREIRLAAGLNHPHILPLYDSGEAGGFLYFVMPVMLGQTLRERLQEEGRLSVDSAVRLTTEVADALDYAHRQDVVHRDIKPENILLHEGHAVVADFGIGKALAAAASENGAMTATGVSLGTPAYMSPEQAGGDPVDGRSDLFALGCVLYEMLTGEAAFAGPTVQALIASRFVHTPPEVSTIRAAVPGALSSLVSRLLAKAPEERLSTGAQVVEALRSGETLATPPRQPEASVAVLPFTNMSADPDNEFFSDGITDDVIVALTAVKGLKVAARTSSFAFKNKNAELATVGKTLGVRTVLQGGVRRVGNRIRVTAQLMDASEGTQIWSERYDRELDDIFAIQDDIARGIVEQLRVRLGIEQAAAPLAARPTDDLEAYQLYLRGREAAYVRSPASLRRAIDYFRQALARDPDVARAHLGLAEAYIGLGVYQFIPTTEAAREAEQALRAAERLQKMKLPKDGAATLAIDPREPLAYAYLGTVNGMLGNLEAAQAATARAIALDPLSLFIRLVSVMGYPVRGIPGADSAAARAAHEAALAMDPNSLIHLWMSAIRLADFGRHDEAVPRLARAVELAQRGPLLVGLYARALALAGRRAEALALREELLARARQEFIGPAAMLMMIGLDLQDEAATGALIEANVAGMTGPVAIATTVARELEPLLDHPRLGPLVRQLTLWATSPLAARPRVSRDATRPTPPDGGRSQ